MIRFLIAAVVIVGAWWLIEWAVALVWPAFIIAAVLFGVWLLLVHRHGVAERVNEWDHS